jgi:hypothetical protein
MSKTKQWKGYVIHAGPEEYGGRNRYIADDGTITDKAHAASFVTFGDAQDFAKAKGITLDGVTRYISQEDFTYGEA